MQQEEADLCQHESVEEESDEECDDDSPLPIEIQRMHLHELTACVGGVLLCRRNPSTDMVSITLLPSVVRKHTGRHLLITDMAP